MTTKKISLKEIQEKIHNKEPVYLLDGCDTDAGYMIMGVNTIVRYPGKAEFSVKTNVPSVYNAMLCGQEITEEQFKSI